MYRENKSEDVYMSTEEVKFKQQVSALNGSQGVTGTGATQQKKLDANAIAEAFKKFAEKNGIKLTTESFLQIVNTHPEIFTLPQDKQASALLKIFNGDKTAEEKPAEQTSQSQQPAEAQTQAPAATTTENNPFTAAMQNNELFTEVIETIQQEETLQAVQNLFETNNIKGESAEEITEALTDDNTPVTEDTPAENNGQTQFKSKAAQIAHQRAEELRKSGHKLHAKIYDRIAAKAEKTQIESEMIQAKAEDLRAQAKKAEASGNTKEAAKLNRQAKAQEARAERKNHHNDVREHYTGQMANFGRRVHEQREKTENQQTESKRDADKFKSETFEKLDDNKKFQEYKTAFAKNLFLNGNPKKTEEEWNNLADDSPEKIACMQKAEEKIQSLVQNSSSKISALFNKLGMKTGEGQDGNIENAVDYQMLVLQAANNKGLTVEEFMKKDKTEQLALIADIIDKDDRPRNELPLMQRTIIENAELLRQAVKYECEKEGNSVGDLSFEEMYIAMRNEDGSTDKDIKIGIALKDYLTHLKETQGKEFPEKYQKQLDHLNRIDPELLKEFGTEMGKPLEAEQAIMNDPSKKEQYEKASDKEKVQMTIDTFFEMHKNPETGAIDEESFMELYKQANRQGRMNILLALQEKARHMPNSEQLLKKILTDEDGRVHSSGQIGTIYGTTEEADLVTSAIVNADKNNPERARLLVQSCVRNMSDPQITYMAPKFSNDAQYSILDEQTGFVTMERLRETYPGLSDDELQKIQESFKNGQNINFIHGAFQEVAANGSSDNEKDKGIVDSITQNEGVVEKIVNGHEASEIKDVNLQGIAANNITDIVRDNEELGVTWANQVPDLYKENQLGVHQKLATSQNDKVAETAAGNIHKYDKSVQSEALKATYNSGNDKAIQAAASNISKMDASVQAEAIKATFATNNAQAIETVLLQANKFDAAALASIRSEFDAQVAKMEEKNIQSIINAYAKRQVNKEFGMKVDNDSQQFKTRLEKYMEEFKNLPTSEIYRRLCADAMFWPADMQAAMLERASRYCPQLFNMMLEKYGVKLLTAFGQINSSTRNEILMQMLKSSTQRNDAMEYLKANPDAAYSDAVKDLYNQLLAEKRGDEYDKVQAQQREASTHQSVPTMAFGSQTGSTRTNFNTEDSYWKTKANLNYYMA